MNFGRAYTQGIRRMPGVNLKSKTLRGHVKRGRAGQYTLTAVGRCSRRVDLMTRKGFSNDEGFSNLGMRAYPRMRAFPI
eukprot:SAG31_NODE_5010_length_2803_cov_1.436760_3_plen_79_part_00